MRILNFYVKIFYNFKEKYYVNVVNSIHLINLQISHFN